MDGSGRPLARHEQLVVRHLDGETLVYKLDVDECLCLEGVAATVWQRCDGTRSIDELARDLPGVDDASAAAVVRITLEQLRSSGLLVEDAALDLGAYRGLTRRQMIKMAGVAAVGVPSVSALLVPSPAAAQSAPLVGGNEQARGSTTTTGSTATTVGGSTTTSSTSTTSTTSTTSSTSTTSTTSTTTPCIGNNQPCAGAQDDSCCGDAICTNVESGPTGFVCVGCLPQNSPCTVGGTPCCSQLVCTTVEPGFSVCAPAIG